MSKAKNVFFLLKKKTKKLTVRSKCNCSEFLGFPWEIWKSQKSHTFSKSQHFFCNLATIFFIICLFFFFTNIELRFVFQIYLLIHTLLKSLLKRLNIILSQRAYRRMQDTRYLYQLIFVFWSISLHNIMY